MSALPEPVWDWLCVYFDDIYDTNMGHNDLLELTLNHLHNESLKPEFFLSLSRTALAVCMGIEKNIADCEQSCGKIHKRRMGHQRFLPLGR